MRWRDPVDAPKGSLENVRVQQGDRRKRLILRGDGDLLLDSEAREKSPHVLFRKIRGMTSATRNHIPPDPEDVSLLGTRAVASLLQHAAHHLQQPESPLRYRGAFQMTGGNQWMTRHGGNGVSIKLH